MKPNIYNSVQVVWRYISFIAIWFIINKYFNCIFMKSLFFSLLTIGVISLYSCAPSYVPNVINTPLLNNKNEIQASVYGGTSGFDPQLAYAITNNIGVMLNGSFENRSDTTNDFHKHNFVELGVGYFNKFNNNGIFEFYGGYGFGKLQVKYEDGIFNSYSDVKTNRIFFQPAIGLTAKSVDFSFSSRFVLVGFEQNVLKYNRSYIEPAFTIKAGFKYIRFVTQMGYSIPLNSNNIVDSQPFMFSIGVQGNINRIFE